MKNILLLLTLLATSFHYAQDMTDMNKWSVGLNFGGHDLHSPINTRNIKLYQPNFVQLNGRYMTNNRFGIQASTSFHFFNIEGAPNVLYTNLSISGIANIGDLMRFNKWTKSFGLLAHSGIGWSGMWQKGYYEELGTDPQNPLHNSVDDMIAFTFGLTPQYKINDQFSLNVDLSFVQHHLQSRSFDWETKLTDRSFNGSFMKLSIGVSYYIGSKARHADWVPTEYGHKGELKNEKYESTILNLELKMQDDDGDGVPNYIDAEPDTPKGSLVDSKGRALKDKDGDGIADEFDKCPDIPGLWSMDGCPDTDGDGVPDHLDKCPSTIGVMSNEGCPEITIEENKLLDKAMKGIKFETGKDIIKSSSHNILDNVVNTLKNHPEWVVEIQGHTDSTGDYEKNKVLSQKRAEAVKSYLESKNVTNKMIPVGYGSDVPKGDNKTAAGRVENRRVEFKISY